MVIKGLETFRNHFKNYNDSYVILGGTACNEWFFEADLEFRLTKDVNNSGFLRFEKVMKH